MALRPKKSAERAYRDAIVVICILEEAGFAARLAGGCVRDRQLNRAPADFDVATTAVPTEVCSLFAQKDFRVIPTGMSHGTVSILMPEGIVEVTTLRRDVDTDGRRAVVAFGGSFEEDAARRDFTINAMYEDRHGQIYDYHNGLEHLKKRELHFVGDPVVRIREDYLRILRFFRFWARFDLTPDLEALTAIAALKDGLKVVSQERITTELLLLLSAEKPRDALKAMRETGLLSQILPEVQVPERLAQVQELANIQPQHRAIARLAVLLRDDLTWEQIVELGARLKLSHKQTKQLGGLKTGSTLLNNPVSNKAVVMDLIDDLEQKTGEGTFLTVVVPTWLVLHPGQRQTIMALAQVEQSYGHLRKAELPVSGQDIMQALNVRPGPKLGKVLGHLKTDFRNEKWRSKSEGIARAQRYWKKIKG